MISGLMVVKMRELDDLIKQAHEKRKEISVLAERINNESVHFDDHVYFRNTINTIKGLLYEINNKFFEINDLLYLEKSRLTRIYIRYWLWIERKWLNPVLRLVH